MCATFCNRYQTTYNANLNFHDLQELKYIQFTVWHVGHFINVHMHFDLWFVLPEAGK